jgi:hypothetical protein
MTEAFPSIDPNRLLDPASSSEHTPINSERRLQKFLRASRLKTVS